MSKQVDKWLKKGRKNCDKGKHWFVLHFVNYLVCPVCGAKKAPEENILEEYNGYLVNPVKFEKAKPENKEQLQCQEKVAEKAEESIRR